MGNGQLRSLDSPLVVEQEVDVQGTRCIAGVGAPPGEPLQELGDCEEIFREQMCVEPRRGIEVVGLRLSRRCRRTVEGSDGDPFGERRKGVDGL
jgi:hypothetical protein